MTRNLMFLSSQLPAMTDYTLGTETKYTFPSLSYFIRYFVIANTVPQRKLPLLGADCVGDRINLTKNVPGAMA